MMTKIKFAMCHNMLCKFNYSASYILLLTYCIIFITSVLTPLLQCKLVCCSTRM